MNEDAIHLIFTVFIFLMFYLVYRVCKKDKRQQLYCTHCGTIAAPKTHVRGAFLIEIVLWLCFIVPGLIYTIWRCTTSEKVCPACLTKCMIPLNSPKAKTAMAEK